jgi:hypothetical protein
MSQKPLTDKGIDRRTFLKVTGAAGIGVAASTFGVPRLLRAAPPTIKIGSVQPATGPLSVIGVGQRRGNQLAVDYINAKGGIKSMGGAKLELLLGDSESKPEVGRSEADRLIKDGAAVMTGPFQSGVALAISTLCEQRQVPFIMDVAALDKITDKGKKFTFRVFITVSGLLDGGVKYLKMVTDLKGVMPKRAVVTNTADAFGKGMSGGFVKFMEKSGLRIEIVDRVEYPLGIHDLSAEVARIKAAKPDILFPVSRPGDGIIHSWLNRMLLPDTVGTGGDSHTRFPMGISFPAGSGLVAFAAATGVMPLDMPESVLVRFKGKMQPGITLRGLQAGNQRICFSRFPGLFQRENRGCPEMANG